MATNIEHVHVSRLREECKHLNIRHIGVPRSDLITELKGRGLFHIDLRFPAKPPLIDTTNRYTDLSNVYLGNGAGLYVNSHNRLYIANSSTETPLIGGCFIDVRLFV